jgi:hypothetical protein
MMHAQNNHRRPKARFDNTARSVNAIHQRHRNIDHGDVGAKLFGKPEGLSSIACFGDDFESGLAFQEQA